MAFLPTELNASGSAFRSIAIADLCPSSQIVQQSDDLHWNLPLINIWKSFQWHNNLIISLYEQNQGVIGTGPFFL